MKVPVDVPVMVLPRSILFPHSLLPLYIFEERYRRMLKNIIRGNRIFGIGTIRKEESESPENSSHDFYDTIGVGVVRVAIDRPDGTTEILIQGICRARVIKHLRNKPWDRVRIQLLESVTNDSVITDALAAKVSELAQAHTELDHKIPGETLRMIRDVRDPDTLSDLISSMVLDNWHDKQTVLETLDVNTRLKKMITFLQGEIDRMQLIQKLENDLKNGSHSLN